MLHNITVDKYLETLQNIQNIPAFRFSHETRLQWHNGVHVPIFIVKIINQNDRNFLTLVNIRSFPWERILLDHRKPLQRIPTTQLVENVNQ